MLSDPNTQPRWVLFSCKAPWRHARNIVTLPDNGDVDISSGAGSTNAASDRYIFIRAPFVGPEQRGSSKGERPRFNSSSDDAVSSTELTISTSYNVFSLASDDGMCFIAVFVGSYYRATSSPLQDLF